VKISISQIKTTVNSIVTDKITQMKEYESWRRRVRRYCTQTITKRTVTTYHELWDEIKRPNIRITWWKKELKYKLRS
jgi:hypothetical protein